MASFVQENRLIQIETPLGADVLILQQMKGREEISQPFHFQLKMLSHKQDIAFKDIITKNVTIKVDQADGKHRFFNGHVSRFRQCDNEGMFAVYEAEVVPWYWFLGLNSDCRIYQDQTVPEIVEEVLKRMGVKKFELKLNRTYQKREYCVQYRESSLNFVSRLLEEEGIFYYFRHEDGSHVMVIGDHGGAHVPTPDVSSFRFEPGTGEGYNREEDFVQGWTKTQEIRTGKHALNDYNFKTASTSLLQQTDTSSNITLSPPIEFYDYPGEYETTSAGEQYTRLHMEEDEVAGTRIHGRGTCRQFSPGFRWELTDHPRSAENGEYVLTSVSHSAAANLEEFGMGESSYYRSEFTCIPRAFKYRPPRTTRKPIVQGLQTAVVVGPSGEEIHTDEYARVKVQFYWDRQGKKDDKSSCWMRVVQATAGGGWGSMFLPRIGHEVVVEFLEGDPDRPIITGSVYNSSNKPNKAMPANKTQTAIRSNSSKGGGGFNELRFDDKKGSEHIFFHAQKDKVEIVKNDSEEHVTRNKSIDIGGAQTETIGGAEDHTVGADQTTSIGGNRATSVGGGDDLSVGGALAQTAGSEISLFAGQKIALQAGMSISLTAGGGFITIDASGVTIQGVMVKINSGGAAGSAKQAAKKTAKKAKKPELKD